MATTVVTTIKVRRDTGANWTSNNPTLALGEIGRNTTNGLLKIGDGTTAWNDLNYFLLDDDDNFAVVGVEPRNATAATIAATPIPQSEIFSTTDTNELGLGVSGDSNGGVLVKNMLGNDFVVPLAPEMLRVWDALESNAVDTAANDDLGLVTGTFLTDSPQIVTGTVNNTTANRKIGLLYTLPRSYQEGENITLRLHAGASDAAEVSMDLDVQAANLTNDATADICATAEQTINTTAADKDFTITGTNCEPGDTLYVVITIDVDDTGGSGADGEIDLYADGCGFRFPGRIA